MNTTTHPVTDMADSTRKLHTHAQDAHRQAQEGTHQARRASEALAELDLERVFGQLRQMVALLNDHDAPSVAQAASGDNVIAFPGCKAEARRPHVLAKAAE